MNENETPGQRARRLLEGTTPGPWRCDRYDVVPTRSVSEGWLIADCGTSESPDAADANVRLISAAPDLARDLIASEERVAALQAQAADLQSVIERVRPVVDALAAACEAEAGDPEKRPYVLAEVMIALGRPLTGFDDDAAWLRSLLSTAPDPAHRPGHTDLMVAPESLPDLAPIECPACQGNGWGDSLEGEDDTAPCAACRGTGLAP